MARTFRWLSVLVGLVFFAPLAAMFAEPFYSGVLARLGIDTSKWADPAVSWVAAIVAYEGFQAAALLFAGIAFGAWGHWIASRYDRKNPSVSGPEGDDSPWPSIADGDDRQMGSRVVPDAVPMTARAFLSAVEPYVDLMFGFFNGTVFELSVSHLEGHIRFMGHDLMHDAKIMTPKLLIPHAKHGNVLVRQHITGQTARIFDEIMSKSQNPMLEVGSFAIYFSYINHKSEQKNLRMAGGNVAFGIDIQRW